VKILSKKSNGEGSIRKRSNGSWEARYTCGYNPDTGKQIRKSIYGHTKQEVQVKLREIYASMDNGTFIEPTKFAVGMWLDTWLEEYKKKNIRNPTYLVYKDAIRLHVNPKIGSILLSKLRPEHIQRLINDLQTDSGRNDGKKGGLSPATVIKIKNILHAAFKQAVKNSLMARNPIEAVEAPKLKQKEIKFLSPQEQETFVSVIKEDRFRPLFLVALGTGMRIGELLALTWDCVDFDKQTLYVNKSLSYTKNSSTNKLVYVVNDPKTPTSRRQIPLNESIIKILRQHRSAQMQERLKAGSAWINLDLVFCTETGNFLNPRNINRKLYYISETNNLPKISFHCLRHTFATRAFEANIKPKVVQEILGHADISMTLNTYTHAMDDTKREEMKKMESILFV
jgi:integrase